VSRAPLGTELGAELGGLGGCTRHCLSRNSAAGGAALGDALGSGSVRAGFSTRRRLGSVEQVSSSDTARERNRSETGEELGAAERHSVRARQRTGLH
jgi:hypothetical protein